MKERRSEGSDKEEIRQMNKGKGMERREKGIRGKTNNGGSRR